MDEFAILSGAFRTSEAQVASLWWDGWVMNELAVWSLALNAIIADLWLVTSSTSGGWLTFVAELAVLAGAVLAVIADLLASWWSGWAIMAELAVLTGAVLPSKALTDTSTASGSSWWLAFMAELTVLAGAVLTIEAHLLASWCARRAFITITSVFTVFATFVAELAILAGAVLAIVADLLGSAETGSTAEAGSTTETWSTETTDSSTFWCVVVSIWVGAVRESAVLSLAVLTFVAVFLATGRAPFIMSTTSFVSSSFMSCWGITIV
jgi:hypothetical protein